MEPIVYDNRRALIVEGAASTFYLIICQGALFTSIALFFGLDVFMLGVAAAFPMAFQVVQVFAPAIVARFRDRAFLLNVFNGLRFVWVVPVAAALAGFRSAPLFLACFGFSQAANSLAGNVWMGLCRDAVPAGERGRFFGRRNVVASLSTIVAVPLFSFMLDAIPEPWNVAAVVAAGLVATVVAIAVVVPIRVPEPDSGPEPTKLSVLASDRDFMKLVVAYLVWNFAVQTTAPFFSYHQIRNLGMSLTLIGVLVTVVNVLFMAAYRGWGKVSDRFGHKSTLMFGLVIVTFIPMMWFFMGPPVWPVLMGVDVVLTSVGWSAVNLAMLTMPLETARSSDPGYFALFNAAGGLGGLAGSMIGGVVAKLVQDARFELLGVTIFGFQAMFLGCGLLRVVATLLFLRVRTGRYVKPSALAMNVLALIARRGALDPRECTPVACDVSDRPPSGGAKG